MLKRLSKTKVVNGIGNKKLTKMFDKKVSRIYDYPLNADTSMRTYGHGEDTDTRNIKPDIYVDSRMTINTGYHNSSV